VFPIGTGFKIMQDAMEVICHVKGRALSNHHYTCDMLLERMNFILLGFL
jgi:hypothetical protein